MPPLKDVTTMVTAARSRLIKFVFIIQNFAQLTQVYGKENGDTIRGNCNLLYLISSELQALEEISKMCGEVKSKEKEKTASTPLVTVSDLQRLNKFEIIVLRRRMFPYKTRFQTDFEVDWGRTYAKSSPEEREKKPLQLFDIKEFVKKQKEEKLKENNPFGGEIGGNPFGGSPNPFMGGNPFGGSNPFMSGNPFGGSPNPFMGDAPRLSNDNMSNGNESFNIDDLVKKIDAKIAEIEEEENNNKIKNSDMKDFIPNKENISAIEEPTENVDKELSVEDKSNNIEQRTNDKQNNTSTIQSMYVDNTDDDDFFDDFFSDE